MLLAVAPFEKEKKQGGAFFVFVVVDGKIHFREFHFFDREFIFFRGRGLLNLKYVNLTLRHWLLMMLVVQ